MHIRINKGTAEMNRMIWEPEEKRVGVENIIK